MRVNALCDEAAGDAHHLRYRVCANRCGVMLDDSRIPIPIPDEPRSPIAVLLGFRHRCDRKDGKPRASPLGQIHGSEFWQFGIVRKSYGFILQRI